MHGLLHPIRGKKGYLGSLFRYSSLLPTLPGHPFRVRPTSLDGRIVPEIFFGRIVVAAIKLMWSHFAHIAVKRNLSASSIRHGEAGFPAALRTDGLAAQTGISVDGICILFMMFFCGFLQMKTSICSCSSCSLAGIFPFRHPETARLQRLQAATGLHPLQSRVDNSLPLSSDSPDLSYIIFS